MIWIEPMQITDDAGGPSGKWRLVAYSDEENLKPVGLCLHEHDSAEEARQCPDARKYADA